MRALVSSSNVPESLSTSRHWMGEIVLAQPLSVAVLSWLSLSLTLLIVIALTCIDYTRKERVMGQLVLDKGMIKIYPQVTGIVVRRLVNEGDAVTRGQPLFSISIDRASLSRGNTQSQVAEQIEIRKALLKAERRKQENILATEQEALKLKISDSQKEESQLKMEIGAYEGRIELSKASLERSRHLVREGFISPNQLEEKQQDILDIQGKLHGLLRAILTLRKEENQLRSELINLPFKSQNQLSILDRQRALIEQEEAENEGKREYLVLAQLDGVATSVLAEVGQTASPEKPIMGLLPAGAKLQAVLLVPTRAYGFISPMQPALLRYLAFPYQKFGQYTGKVREIGKTTLSADEMKILGMSNDPYYRVVVALDSQDVMAYGKPVRLSDGMQVEADILIDTRKLYEWVLEPLLSVTGKL